MSRKHLFTGFVAVVSALLVACGGDVTEITEVNETGMKIIEKGEKLPSCTTENEGTMVYALDSAAAYLCVNRDWTSFNGKDGTDGKDGVDGEKGEKGDQGKKGDKGDQGESGEKGDAGEDGTSCTVEQLPDSSGFKVICGGDSVGVVLNGEKGDKGDKGDQGEDGKSVEGAENFFIDARDKQIYRFVTIGDQTWMAENLNYETDSSHCYKDSAKYCAKYGRYYTWADAMDSAAVFSEDAKGCGDGKTCTIKTPARGICPEGWHMPDTTEWRALYKAVGESPYAMQAKGFEKWPNATDAYGFSARPAGGGLSGYNDSYVLFSSATEDGVGAYSAYYWHLGAGNAYVSCSRNDGKAFAYPVRCVKD